jgi:hypothetical protein
MMDEFSRLTAGEQADHLAGNMLGFFGAIKNPTPEQRKALADEFIRAGIHWCNEEFDLGLKF